MSHYAIGDVHGCWYSLETLLEQLEFNPKVDRLWFVGDLINRGLGSLECLRFAFEHRACTSVVLGNHEIHLLAVARGHRKLKKRDTLSAILDAPDGGGLIDWVRGWPLAVVSEISAAQTWLMTHAGVSPRWSAHRFMRLAEEAELLLREDDLDSILSDLYSADSEHWQGDSPKIDRVRAFLRFVISARTCTPDGRLDPRMKGAPEDAASGYKPWFAWHPEADGSSSHPFVVFGHWAALGFNYDRGHFGLDTGCVWGGRLTALRLEDHQTISVPADPRDLAPDPAR